MKTTLPQQHTQITQKQQLKPRKHKRSSSPFLFGDLATNNNVFQGTVADYSTGGIKLADISEDFSHTKELCTVFLSMGQDNYRLVVKPCWFKKSENSSNLEVGCQIVDAPWKWIQMTMDVQSGKLKERWYTA